MLDDVRERLEQEADRLLHELNVLLPGEIEKAAAQGDLRENSEYAAALERQRFVHARLETISRRLSQISELNLEDIPPDRVGFGSRVLVRDRDTGEEETYVLVLGDDLDFDSSEISMRSPIGRALLGKRPGAVVNVTLPRGSVEYEVLHVTTVHELLGVAGSDGAAADGGPSGSGTGSSGGEDGKGEGDR